MATKAKKAVKRKVRRVEKVARVKKTELTQAADRLEAPKATYSAHTTLAAEVGNLTPRERVVVAFALHEVAKALRG